jgi:hypothetical protein
VSHRPRTCAAKGLRAVLHLVALVLVVGGCVAPAFDSGAFHRNAIHALDSAVSETRTAALAVGEHLAGRIVRTYADTLVTDSEDALGPVEDSFGAVDPPTPTDEKLRDDVGGLLSDAADALSTARIALRKGDTAAMTKSVAHLTSVADRMDQASEQLS